MDSLNFRGVPVQRGEVQRLNCSECHLGTEALLYHVENPHDANCISVFVGDLNLGHVAAEVSQYLCNFLPLYRIT